MINNNSKDSILDLDNLKMKLQSHQRESRIEAIQIIADNKLFDGISLLHKLITDDPDPVVREIAIVGLADFKQENSLDIFCKAIQTYKERNNFVKARAIWALGNYKAPSIRNLLEKALDDENLEVQYWAIVNFVHNYPDDFPVTKLLGILHKSNKNLIRQTIVWAFGMIKYSDANKTLIDFLLKDDDVFVRLNAAWSLSKINDLTSASALSYALKNELNALVKREMAIALGNILEKNNRESYELEKISTSENNVDEAITALSMVLQRDSIYYVRRACAEALGKICSSKAVTILIDIYTSEVNQFVRKEIAEALGKIGDPSAIPILRKSLRSHYQMVVKAANKAIEEIVRNS